jgi:hypothetical protein
MIHIHWSVRVAGDKINGYYACRCGRRRQIVQRDRNRPMDFRWALTGEFADEPETGPEGHRTWITTERPR